MPRTGTFIPGHCVKMFVRFGVNIFHCYHQEIDDEIFLPIAFFAFVQICFGAEWGDAGIKLNTKQVKGLLKNLGV